MTPGNTLSSKVVVDDQCDDKFGYNDSVVLQSEEGLVSTQFWFICNTLAIRCYFSETSYSSVITFTLSEWMF